MLPDWLPRGIWLVLTIASIAWYCTITVYVAIRGVFDIRSMLKELKKQHAEKTTEL